MVACPFCGSEMTDGAIGLHVMRGGAELLWCGTPERGKLFWKVKESEVLFPVKQSGLFAMPMCPGFRCESCQSLVMKYSECYEQPIDEEASADEDQPIDEEIPVEEERHVDEGTPIEADKSVDEEVQINDYQPTNEECSIDDDQPIDDEGPVDEDQPVEEEGPVDEDNPVDEEPSVEKDASDVHLKPKKFKFE